LLSATLILPQAASGPVSWTIRDYNGNLVVRGKVAPSGTNVVVSVVLPANCKVPPDGSKYVISATDGITSTSEAFSVLAPIPLATSHGTEVAYMQGRVFQDSLILAEPAENISITVVSVNGQMLIPQTLLPTQTGYRRGDAWVYSFDYSATTAGAAVTPPGVLNTFTSATLGCGIITWDYTGCNDIEASQEVHPFFTITPYSSTYMTDIRMLVDKARIGDVNEYLAYKPSDLAHSLLRGNDYVMQSAPVAGGWPLDLMPLSLKDYIVKASALDILRAQYQAEGMSQFDMQGLGVQLQVDRTQYLAQLIGEMTQDLALLPGAKNNWMAQGAPLGPQLAAGKRPIGILGLSRGVYSTFPMYPLPIVTAGYSFLGYGAGFGPLF